MEEDIQNLPKIPTEDVEVTVHRDPNHLLRELEDKRIDPEDITMEERRACIFLLMGGKYKQSELASMFGVSRSTISRDIKNIQKEVGAVVKEMGIEQLLGDMYTSMETCYTKAISREDANVAWKIKSDFYKLLQSLGMVHKEPDKLEIGLTQEEIQRRYEQSKDLLSRTMTAELSGEIIDTEDEDIIEMYESFENEAEDVS